MESATAHETERLFTRQSSAYTLRQGLGTCRERASGFTLNLLLSVNEGRRLARDRDLSRCAGTVMMVWSVEQDKYSNQKNVK